MSSIILIASPNEDRNGSSASWISYNSTSLSALITNLLNSNNGMTVGSGWKGQMGNYVKSINNNEDCIARMNYGTNSDLYSTLRIQFNSQADRDYYESDMAGKLLEIIGIEGIPWNGSYTNIPVYWFKMVLPHLTSQNAVISLISPTCLWDKYQDLALGELNFSNNAMSSTFMMAGQNYTPPDGQTKFGLFSISDNVVPPEPDCEDLRNSENQQSLHLVVSDGQNNTTITDITFNLSDGANQELALRTYMNDTVYNYFNNIYNQNQDVKARIMFNGGVCRSACTVRIVAKVYGQAVSVEPSLMPPYVTLDNDILAGHDVDILRATFEECNDKPVRIEEDLVAYLDGLKSQNFFSVGFSIYQVVPYKIVITGCEALTEWCCDDVAPIENDSIEYEGYEKPLIEGYGSGTGGGGSDVDISCICDGLTSLNQMLATKLDNLVDGQAVIAGAITEMQVEVDNTCVCDNLESINDNLEAIKESIDDKNLSVVNNNTVQPPVNNVSIQPPVNNISLPTTQLENIATNTRALNCVCASLQNLEVIEQGTKESIDGVKSNLQCGSDGIACVLQGKDISVDVDFNTTDIINGLEAITEKLDDIDNSVHDGLINSDDESNLENISQSLNTSDDEPISLADVIKDKEMATNIDVEVSPADDVNINRVYYTNQRNGETNI